MPDDDADQSSQPSPDPQADLLVPPSRQAGRRGMGSDAGDAAPGTGPASHLPGSLRHVDWAGVFPFVHLFKGFRLAVHPAKLLLALAAVLLIYGGGRALDGIWGLLPGDRLAVADEVAVFEQHRDAAARGALPPGGSGFADARRRAVAERDAGVLALRRQVARERGAASVDSVSFRRLRRPVRRGRGPAGRGDRSGGPGLRRPARGRRRRRGRGGDRDRRPPDDRPPGVRQGGRGGPPPRRPGRRRAGSGLLRLRVRPHQRRRHLAPVARPSPAWRGRRTASSGSGRRGASRSTRSSSRSCSSGR